MRVMSETMDLRYLYRQEPTMSAGPSMKINHVKSFASFQYEYDPSRSFWSNRSSAMLRRQPV